MTQLLELTHREIGDYLEYPLPKKVKATFASSNQIQIQGLATAIKPA
ncbi:hypothetical protein [Volucribacter amazonae]|nr:hypothetical protein [Volucribacter amazonae]